MIRIALLTVLLLLPCILQGQVNLDSEPDSSQLATLKTLKQVNENLYYMEYSADYFFDSFKEKGIGDLDMEGFIKEYLEVRPDSSLWACSAFMVNNRKGEVYVGRNFDWKTIPGMVLLTEPDSGYKSLSVVPIDLMKDNKLLWAPYFPVEGINEKGLVVVELAVEGTSVKHPGKVSMLSLHLIRLLLDNAKDINESISLLSHYNNAASHRMHFFIADSTGSSAVVEYIDNEMHVTRNKESWQAVTNNMVYRASDKRLRKECGRYNYLSQYLEAHSAALSAVGCMNMLRSVSVNRVYSSQFDITTSTQWSVVYNINERYIDLVSGRDFRNKYRYNLFNEDE